MCQRDWREEEGSLLKRAVLVSLALLVSGALAAGEMESPVVTLSDVNWDAAVATLTDHATGPPAEAFARLNAITGKRFAGIAKSAVPVLLPFNVDAFRKDLADGKAEAATSEKYFGGFHPTKFFLPGPAGYDATFTLSNKEDGLKIGFEKPILFEISGAAFVYNLDPPNHVEKESMPKELEHAVSRHPPNFERSACALCVRALRRALRAVDPVLRHAAVVPASFVPGSRSAGGAVFEFAAHGRRHAGKIHAAEIRSQPAAGNSRISLITVRAI